MNIYEITVRNQDPSDKFVAEKHTYFVISESIHNAIKLLESSTKVPEFNSIVSCEINAKLVEGKVLFMNQYKTSQDKPQEHFDYTEKLKVGIIGGGNVGKTAIIEHLHNEVILVGSKELDFNKVIPYSALPSDYLYTDDIITKGLYIRKKTISHKDRQKNKRKRNKQRNDRRS